MAMIGGKPTGTRVEQCVEWVLNRIHGQVFRSGMRLPSIRALARELGVSPFTASESYEHLVTAGYIEARRGSGFYVRQRQSRDVAFEPPRATTVDHRWLLRHMLEGNSSSQGPGSGVLPAEWLDGARIGAALRALGRQGSGNWLKNSEPRGFQPLRQVLQGRLARLDIVAHEEQIVMTSGVTHALDLVVRTLVAPGETVLTFDPCWFGTHGVLARHAVNVVGVPLTPTGPDLERLETLAAEYQPKLLVMSTAAPNPTGVSMSQETIRRILAISHQHGFHIVEDDVYADLCDTSLPRIATSDGLEQVIYGGSFSKTLASNVRVGFIACRAELAEALSDTKILSASTTPEMNERLVHQLLSTRQYDQHARVLREQLAAARDAAMTMLKEHEIEVFGESHDGLFAWINMRGDTNQLAVQWREQGLLLAPGGLFSPSQTPSQWMRFNVTSPLDGRVVELLQSTRRNKK
jgi:DNA-binding transcriptional MocR family regulator